MKRILLLALMLVASAQMVQLSAQQLVKKRVGSYIESGNVVVAEAATTLAVDLVVESESVEVGITPQNTTKIFFHTIHCHPNVLVRQFNTKIFPF